MPLSPTKRSRRSDTPFTKEQEIWLVKRSAFMGPTELRRAFIREFLNPRNEHQNAPGRDTFRRLIKRFDDSGGVTGRRMENEALITVSTPENIARVERYFTENECKVSKMPPTIWKCRFRRSVEL